MIADIGSFSLVLRDFRRGWEADIISQASTINHYNPECNPECSAPKKYTPV